GREVHILFDSDVGWAWPVRSAATGLAEHVARLGGQPIIREIPDPEHLKLGIDDWLAEGQPVESIGVAELTEEERAKLDESAERLKRVCRGMPNLNRREATRRVGRALLATANEQLMITPAASHRYLTNRARVSTGTL